MQPSDDELVARCLAGSNAAFRELVERHQKRVYSLALRMMGNHTDAEDLAQEAFVRAYSALPRYRGPGGFASWLCRIAVNLCLNAARDSRRTIVVDPSDIEGLYANAAPCDQSESVGRSEAILTAIRSLDEGYRAVVLLRFMDGLSYAEIAEVLSVPVSTIAARLHRAKKLLRDLLKEWVLI